MNDVELQNRVVLSLFRGAPNCRDLAPVDLRAWRTDGFRAARLAQAALERLPVSATVYLGLDGAFEQALEFSTSSEFEAVVEARSDLLAAFTQYVRRCGVGAAIEALLALDEAIVSIRDPFVPETGGDAVFILARRCSVLHLPVGTSEWHAGQRALINQAPGASLWERVLRTASFTRVPAFAEDGVCESVLVVCEGRGEGSSVELLSDDMSNLLEFLSVPRSLQTIVSRLSGELAPDEAIDVLESLVEDGVVLRIGGGL